MAAISVAGFGAMPSKPDFAFPKTVSKNAEAELKSALRRDDGPATVRALLNYGLAQTAIAADRKNAVMEYFTKTEAKVKSPVTKAMIQLAKANAEYSDSLTVATINEYGDALKEVPTADWSDVVNADERFFPTLYDFAAAQVPGNDSIAQAAYAYNADNVFPRIYIALQRARDFESTLKVYETFAATPAADYALEALAIQANDIDRRKQVYELCLRRGGMESDAVSKVKAFLTRKSATLSAPSVIGLNKTLKVNVKTECANRVNVKIVRKKPAVKTIKTISLDFAGSGVFEADTTIDVSFDSYGVYSLTTEFEGVRDSGLKQYVNEATVYVTDFLLSQAVYGKSVKTMALDAINGAEQNDVTFTTVDHRITGARGADKYSPDVWAAEGHEPYAGARNFVNLLTDRAIYHPGDSVRFAGTVMTVKGMERKPASGESVTAELRNANYQTIDRLTLASDDFGRISGAFKLPSEGLTGNFQIRLENLGSCNFTVSDYKAPTFAAEITATRLSETEVQLSGSATGYNGFPIADARVAVNVKKLPRWIWYWNYRSFNEEPVATDTVTTDAEGKFTVKITVPKGENLSAAATVTTLSGESHDADCFIPDRRYFISAEIPQYLLAGHAPKISVMDSKGENVVRPLEIRLTSVADSTAVITPDADWSDIPSGAYRVRITTADADTVHMSTCVYRMSDSMPPEKSALFVPVQKVHNTAKVLIGTSYRDSHILYTLWTPDSIIEQRWLTPAMGNFIVSPNLPAGVNEATLTLHTLRDYKFSTRSITVSRPNTANRLDVTISSLRDKTTPGSRETWTISVKDNLGHPAGAAVMVDVYSKALDALVPMRWGFNVPPVYGRYLNFNDNSPWPATACNIVPVKMTDRMAAVNATFNLYGQHWPFEPIRNLMYATTATSAAPRMLMKSMAVMNDMAVEESAAEYDISAAEEEIVSADSADADGGLAEQKAGNTKPASNDDGYRMPEVPVALWQPVLTTGADGMLQIVFDVPNANTTWAVKTLAYDRRLLFGTQSAEIIASKPVMVQPQLPRFLRMTDSTELRAMVQNNTDSAATVSAFIELYDPATDAAIGRKDFELALGAMESQVISMQLTAPEASLLGVRVRATAGNFTDGEQAVMPVLPADVKVRTGRPLFAPADSTELRVDVARGGVMTFTANATWECVASLPGLQTNESSSAFASISALFSAATARGLLRDHPEIGVAIKRWQQEDSVLVSRLERNEDLRIALLGSTPWVCAAQSETERRARLMLLFDNKEIDRTINGAVGNLAKLVKGGGLDWTANDREASLWVTVRVLRTVAQLKRMGYLPQNSTLDRIVSNALQYVDKEVARDFAKDKRATYPDYTLMRPQFPEVRQIAPARRAQAATVQYLVGHWRDLSTESLARAAIILNENNYPTTARKLIESLRQHEAWNSGRPSAMLLDAFATVEPHSPEVDIIRTAYIARKQSTDWGNGMAATDLIAAILNSGSPWLVPAANELSVRVDGVETDPHAESIMGEFRLDLPEGGTVEISKGNFPCWGGVFSASTDSIKAVEAFGSDKLTITRTMEGELAVGNKITLTLTLDAATDMDYVIVRQPRCAAFEPVDQLPSSIGIGFYHVGYREPCATVTNWFINRLPKGKTVISETFYVTATGRFALAPAEAQSQYAPEFQAHTAGAELTVPQ